ncbi:MAG: eukaryotic-like serine/threonine-protein kinase [Frankiales bacterium]|nr:eukaryotic-like serine/threonine-protein kinase [Frankiales bacterium]
MTSPGDDDPTRAVPSVAVIGGRYRLDVLVGRGGTAEVWAATDTSLDRTVALKLVTVAHDESAARAADEARTLAQLSHPNLVQVFDAGTDGAGRPWVVMEYVDGDTLGDAMRKGPLPIAKVTEIGIAVADALAHVHATGLVHRDVKPGNVLLGRVPKLTDFGIARLVDAAKVTTTGLMVGTAAYLAPEQVAGEPIGPAADVYALGLLLLEVLTGTREYEGPPVEAAMARLSRPPAIPATLPTGWAALLTAMTAREAAQRPTASQVAAALRNLQAGTSMTTVLPAAAAPVGDRTTVMPRTAAVPTPVAVRSSSRRGWWVVVALAVVLAGVGGGIVASQQNKPAPHQIPTVNDSTPDNIKTPLKNLVGQVNSL